MEAASIRSSQNQLNATIELHWPTDYYVVTQAFNANPEMHADQNLPGHEGLDIRAPLNCPVYACSPGEVIEAHNDRDDSSLGRYVSIRHQNGYLTVYGHLSKTVVNRGQKIKAGDEIAFAGPTGQTSGGHIHLTLKLDGASAAGLTHFPDDTIDPTPFLVPPPELDASKYAWPIGRCLMGVSIRADGTWSEDDLAAIKRNSVEAVKLGVGTNQAQMAQLKQINSAFFLMSQLLLPSDGKPFSARDWVARIRPMFKQHVEAGVTYFEIGRTPNLYADGCYVSWNNGAEFGRWWLDVVNILKADAPETRFGIPAPAPGAGIGGQRMDAHTFLEGADEWMLSADWIGVSCNWDTETEMLDENNGSYYAAMRRYYPNQVLFITEFGNSAPAQAGQAVQAFYKKIVQTPGIGAIFA